MLKNKNYETLKNSEKNALNSSIFKLMFSYYMLFKSNASVCEIENKNCYLKEFFDFVLSNEQEKKFFMHYSQIYLYDDGALKLKDFLGFVYKIENVKPEIIDIEQENIQEVVCIIFDYMETIYARREFLFQGDKQ
jgi:hypothetical protein